MRDFFDTVMILEKGLVPEMIPLNPEKGKLFLLTPIEKSRILKITKELKIRKIQVIRAFEIIKYCVIQSGFQGMMKTFKADIQ